ncbi:MAG: PadR family transcriptional regulator [Candidatus Heimdallarchaeota archaeon]|nr:PadR family transcriptional regulator [Candidatus Heimdallarchaeota archaeon]
MTPSSVDVSSSYLTRLEKDAKGSLTAILILTIINHDEMTWGYKIKKKLSEITNRDIEVNYSTLYTILRNFEEKYFLVDSKMEDKRRYYSITNKGRQILSEMSDFWDNLIDTSRVAFKNLEKSS